MAIGGMHPVEHKKHWSVPAKDGRLPEGAVFMVSGEASSLWIRGYDAWVDTYATVLEQPNRADRKVLVCLDEIAGEYGVNVFIRKEALKDCNRFLNGSRQILARGLTEGQWKEAKELKQTLSYDEMDRLQVELVVALELEMFKPKLVDLLENGFPEGQLQEQICDWKEDYQMAGETEERLREFAETIAKGPKAIGGMMRFREKPLDEKLEEVYRRAENGACRGIREGEKGLFL